MTTEAELVEQAMLKLAARRRSGTANSLVSPNRTSSSQPQDRDSTPLESQFDGLHEAAAVLGWFDVERLRPTKPVANGARDLLVAIAITVLDDQGELQLSLPAEVRIAVLRQMRIAAQVDRALAVNVGAPGDTLHWTIRRHLTDPNPPLDELTLVELQTAALVCDWLHAAGFAVTDARRIARRMAWLTLLEPFEHLAGEHFRGRTIELARLRAYAGVLPPGELSGTAPVTAGALPMVPLLIYGHGGVGKSTLVARFILEHARAVERERFPFVYLDFDRPDVDAAEPLTLLIEAVRQLAIEYPEIGQRADGIREDWLLSLHESKGVVQVRARAAADFGRLVDSIGASGRPAVFVLDTFEEVQWRSREYVQHIVSLLAEISSALPALRVIIAGRGEIPDVAVEKLELTGLDHDAAVEFLQALGVDHSDASTRIAAKVGGDPQNLKLAASDYLATRAKGQGSTLDVLDHLDEGMITHKLHRRVLDHIHDESVRRLAHPGLVLRRLTAPLILDVLAGPCELSISTLPEAEKLFVELERESALVKVDSDGALIHLPELRKAILSLLEKDEPDRSAEIHAGAVSFYAKGRAETIERAEEIYHRLKLEQDRDLIIRRWLPGIESRLINAVDEFDGARNAFLAAQLGLDVSDPVRRSAALPDWERLVASRVRSMIDNGEAAGALALCAERSDRTPAGGLVALEVEASITLGRTGIAQSLLEGAADRAEAAGLDDVTYQLLRLAGGMAVVGQQIPLSGWIEQAAERLASTTGDQAHGLLAAAVTFAAQKGAPDSVDPRRLRLSFDSVDDARLRDDPELLALTCSLFNDTEDAPRLGRALGLLDQPTYDPSQLRALASQLAQFDRTLAYAVSRRYGLEMKSSGTETWSDHLLQKPAVEATATILRVLEDYGLELPEPVIISGAAAIGSTLSVSRWNRAAQGTVPGPLARDDQPPNSSADQVLSSEVHAELVESLSRVFTRETLRNFLRLTLDLSLDSLVPAGVSLIPAVAMVVDYLARDGSLTKMLAGARAVAPSDPGLLDVAEAIGLSTLAGDAANRPLPGASLDTAQWREHLGRIEGQVCRIERSSSNLFKTGFLVGERLVLTAWLELSSTIGYQCRFDSQATTDGSVVSGGRVFPIREVVAWGLADGPGFMLVALDGSPGVQPVGGPASASDIPRGWLQVPTTSNPSVGDSVMMAHHATGAALVHSAGTVVGYSADQAQIYYRLNATPGSAGAPIFDANLNPVALHIGRRSDGNGFGAPLASVRKRLDELGQSALFNTTLA